VSYGAAIGHITPEAKRGGGILYLQTGDIIQSNLRARSVTLIDRDLLRESGEIIVYTSGLTAERRELGAERLRRINRRLLDIAPTNRMRDVTDAAHGVVPEAVAECASQTFAEIAARNLALASDHPHAENNKAI
jgi:dihydroxyacid dehydratase/phosphogluconate dehydratase